jgi:hypothetical protein
VGLRPVRFPSIDERPVRRASCAHVLPIDAAWPTAAVRSGACPVSSEGRRSMTCAHSLHVNGEVRVMLASSGLIDCPPPAPRSAHCARLVRSEGLHHFTLYPKLAFVLPDRARGGRRWRQRYLSDRQPECERQSQNCGYDSGGAPDCRRQPPGRLGWARARQTTKCAGR